MIKDSIEYLIKTATNPPYSNNLLAARQEYQKYTGDIYDDDKSYDNQMALFLEWYIFDRIDSAHNQTVLELIINNEKEASLDLLKNINVFTSHIHGLFIIKKIKDDCVKVINLFDNEQYNVVEPSGSSISVKIVYSRRDFLLMKIPITLQGTFVFIQMVQKNSLKVKQKRFPP